MSEDDKRNCCLVEIQETEAKYYKTLEDIEKVMVTIGAGCFVYTEGHYFRTTGAPPQPTHPTSPGIKSHLPHYTRKDHTGINALQHMSLQS